MANVLLVDPAEVAGKALQGILDRGRHRLATVSGAEAARTFLRQNPGTDLLMVEVALEGAEDGVALLEWLRRDPFLRELPALVYTDLPHRDAARRVLSLEVQNFLFKPYVDTDVFPEIGKAIAHPWRQKLLDDERVYCARQRISPEELRQRREALQAQLEAFVRALSGAAVAREKATLLGLLEELLVAASESGVGAIATFLEALYASLENEAWPEVDAAAGTLQLAAALVANRLHPGAVTTGFLLDHERRAEEEARARGFWAQALADNLLPVISGQRLEREVDELPGCPIIDSVAAAYRMAATGHPSSLAPLLDLTEKDPGLSAQVLISANQARHHQDSLDLVDNARLGVGLLGEERLANLADQLVTVEARLLDHPPFTWSQFWMFQLGVAQLARHTCTYLELESLESRAYTAGLLHDIGKLLLARLEPYGLRAALDYARQHRVPLAVAERTLFEVTSRELAARFAARRGLPECYVNVIRCLNAPAEAGADAPLVAIVSLARHLCIQNHVGCSGEAATQALPPIDETAEWEVLRTYVYPSFNLPKFEAQVHAMSRELTRELCGRGGTPAGAGRAQA